MYRKDYEVELTKENISGEQEYVKNYNLKDYYSRIKTK
jgi:hypothetical protein